MKKFEKISTFIEMSENDSKKLFGGKLSSVNSGGGLTAPLTTAGNPPDQGPADHAAQD